MSAYGAQPPSGQSDRVLADDLGHIRALVERAVGNQADIQRVSIALYAHQTRMLQINGQLETVRRELAAAAPASVALARLVKEASAEESNAPTPDAREAAAGLRPVFELQLAAIVQHEQQLKSRERELRQQFEAEERRWTELASILVELSVQ
jgi:hypothetical protein